MKVRSVSVDCSGSRPGSIWVLASTVMRATFMWPLTVSITKSGHESNHSHSELEWRVAKLFENSCHVLFCRS
jgi:hypothetical protein